LFLPKILGAALVVVRDRARFGGMRRVLVSLVIEIVLSALLAPIRMLFHTQFVVAALVGLESHWKSQPREDAQTTWGEAVRRHGVHTLIGITWATGVAWLDTAYVWWLLPVAGALALSIPLSVYSSRVSLGRALRRAGLLLIPEETDPPAELGSMRAYAGRGVAPPPFEDVVVDPVANAIACAMSSAPPRLARRARRRHDRAIATAVARGPAALTDREKLFLLTDPAALSQLHFDVWTSPSAHPSWGVTPIDAAPDAEPALRKAS
jgi:membrane glycosyltransferase